MNKKTEVLKLWLTLMSFPKAYAVLKVLVGDPLDKTIEITQETLGETDSEPANEPPVSPGTIGMNGAGSIFMDDQMLWWSADRLTQGQAAAMRRALEIVNKEGLTRKPKRGDLVTVQYGIGPDEIATGYVKNIRGTEIEIKEPIAGLTAFGRFVRFGQ